MDRPKYVNKFIELAKKVSRNGIHHRYLVGAVLVKNGQPIAWGSNNNKTHTLMMGQTLHAEISCLIGKRYRDLHNTTMFVARTSKKHNIVGMARPCPTCRSILTSFGIKDVYFTGEKGIVDYLKLC